MAHAGPGFTFLSVRPQHPVNNWIGFTFFSFFLGGGYCLYQSSSSVLIVN